MYLLINVFMVSCGIYASVKADYSIPPKHKRLAKECWANVEHYYLKIGLSLFKELFYFNPEYTIPFHNMKESLHADLLESPKFKEFITKEFFPDFGQIINSLDDPAKLDKVTKDYINNYYIKMHLSGEMLKDMHYEMVYAIEEVLYNKFTHEVKAEFDSILKFLFDVFEKSRPPRI